ncbi:MAG: nucleotidyltransferase family protein [Nitrospira sp.]|nr:nucleotidyltransferase family protein [Nitrospira sp.]MDH4245832.1 nucleotidyltransferase family protein [Nitrospira sp.]MDH4355268.1 nucleotidyltransferase family protein [Nitrospira sp.]MDH5317498.1 nucleotidyltransferase family protein [Nitrospira sp.]
MPTPSVARQFPLTPEAELLVWCARTIVSDDLKTRIRHQVQASLDWAVVLAMAEYHGVSHLLHRNLSTICPNLVPLEPLAHLRKKTQAGALLNRSLAQEVITLCEAFQARGVPVIPIKGATLAVLAYGDLTLRDFTDLDLLVPEDSVEKAQVILSALGYDRRSVVAEQSDRHHDHGPHQVFVKRRTLCRVDLQWVMAHQHFAFRLDRPEFWARRVGVAFANQTVPGLAPEMLLIVLCVHGSKHAWEHLKWVCDVAEFVRSHPDLGWNQIFVHASTWRCRRMLYLGLSVAHIMLDAPLPAAVLERLKTDVEVEALAHRMPASLLSDAHQGITEEQAGALYFSVKDSWSERWWLGLSLCRAHSPVAITPPSWCHGGLLLSCLAQIIVPLHREVKRLLSPRIRGVINRWFAFIGEALTSRC